MIECVQASARGDLNLYAESYMTSNSTEFGGGDAAGLTYSTVNGNEVVNDYYFFISNSNSRTTNETVTGLPTYYISRQTEGHGYQDLMYSSYSESQTLSNENEFHDPIPGTTEMFYTAWNQQIIWYEFDYVISRWTKFSSLDNNEVLNQTYKGTSFDTDLSETITTSTEISSMTETNDLITFTGIGVPDWVHISQTTVAVDSGASGYTTMYTTGEYWVPSVDFDGNFLYTSVVVDSWTTTTTSAYCTVAGVSNILFEDPSWLYENITVYVADYNALQCDQIFVPPDTPPLFTPVVFEEMLINYGNVYYRYPNTVLIFDEWARISSYGPSPSTWTIPKPVPQPNLTYVIPAVTSFETYADIGYSEGYLPMDMYTYVSGYQLTGMSTAEIPTPAAETTTVLIAWSTTAIPGPIFGPVPDPAVFIWNDFGGAYYMTYDSSSLAVVGSALGIDQIYQIILTFIDANNTIDGFHGETRCVGAPATYVSSPPYYFYNIVPTYKNGFQVAPLVAAQGLNPVFKGVGASIPMPWGGGVGSFYNALVGAGVEVPFQLFYEGDDDFDGIGASSFIFDGTVYEYLFGTSDIGVPMFLTTYLETNTDVSQAFTNHLFGIDVAGTYRSLIDGVGLPAAGGLNTILIWGSYGVTDCMAGVSWQQSYQEELNIGEGQLSIFGAIGVNVYVTDFVPGLGGYDLDPVAMPLYPGNSQATNP